MTGLRYLLIPKIAYVGPFAVLDEMADLARTRRAAVEAARITSTKMKPLMRPQKMLADIGGRTVNLNAISPLDEHLYRA